MALTTTKTLTAQYSAACADATCMIVGLGRSGGVSVQVKGMTTGTITPLLSLTGDDADGVAVQVYPSNSDTAQATITANGVYHIPCGAGGLLVFRFTTKTTGNPTITVLVSPVLNLNK